MAKTPLFDALQNYIENDMSRFHMPGHKGVLPVPLGQAAMYDVTEIAGTDSLYEASGAIAETEKIYSGIYGTKASVLSAGGSTLCIQAMLASVLSPGEKIVCGREVHTSAVNTMALIGAEPVWVYPDMDTETGMMTELDPEKIKEALAENTDAKAVYITSPNYFGIMPDIKAIAAICHSFGVPLLVDNAHGAHLKFLPSSLHPIDLGADMCADSLHKSLPVLTGGAMLHINNEKYVLAAKAKMALFGSTSPSYLIMLSCDMAIDYIKNNAASGIENACKEIARLKKFAVKSGFALPCGSIEPMRLVLGFWKMGYTKSEFACVLRENKIEPEYLGEYFCVLLAGEANSEKDFLRIRHIIETLPKRQALAAEYSEPCIPKVKMPLRDAVFAEFERVDIDNSTGRTAAGMITPCPPGIPVVVPGEEIVNSMLPLIKSYGILHINVVK